VVKVYGNDFAETRQVATAITRLLKTVPGAQDVIIDQEPPLPQVRIDVDRAAAARLGINVADVMALIQTGIGGSPSRRCSSRTAATTWWRASSAARAMTPRQSAT
jgi:cobalt-zinc-cadmium resistance protein CzcA